jgi:hypothetical protein
MRLKLKSNQPTSTLAEYLTADAGLAPAASEKPAPEADLALILVGHETSPVVPTAQWQLGGH